jgi:hypothetical protein
MTEDHFSKTHEHKNYLQLIKLENLTKDNQ